MPSMPSTLSAMEIPERTSTTRAGDKSRSRMQSVRLSATCSSRLSTPSKHQGLPHFLRQPFEFPVTLDSADAQSTFREDCQRGRIGTLVMNLEICVDSVES